MPQFIFIIPSAERIGGATLHIYVINKIFDLGLQTVSNYQKISIFFDFFGKKDHFSQKTKQI